MKRATQLLTVFLTLSTTAALLSAAEPAAEAVGRWSVERANQWYQQQPWLVGCNFSPSTAINQLEMWQADTFDAATIDRELGWAAGIGMNTARVFLHDQLWQQDRQGFLERMERFLVMAEKHGIRPMFVLFDNCWNPHPKLGQQPAPTPHVHNSGWVQSPHIETLRDVTQHDGLEGYVTGVMQHFKDDRRILAWDLFNEPGNDSPRDQMTKVEKEEKSLALLRKTFAWARKVAPSQPLTVGVWIKEWSGPNVTPLNRFMLENADIISFHAYDRLEQVRKKVESLRPLARPLLCTEYLARTAGNTFEDELPYFKTNRIAAYNWGFVAGKTQTQYPWSSWKKTFTAEPAVWHHDILRPDGTPFSRDETELIKSLTAEPAAKSRR
jgi:hypothetical protein